MSDITIIEDIAAEVVAERLNQIEQWGQQDHPSYFDQNGVREARKASERYHAINDARVREGSLTWDGILLEEVYEALSEVGETQRRAELIQVAAVALAEIEAIDRRLAGPLDPAPAAEPVASDEAA